VSLKTNIVLSVALCVATCLGVSLVNDFFSRGARRAEAAQRLLSSALMNAQQMRLAESEFLSTGSDAAWGEFTFAFENTNKGLVAFAAADHVWSAPGAALRRALGAYKTELESSRKLVQEATSDAERSASAGKEKGAKQEPMANSVGAVNGLRERLRLQGVQILKDGQDLLEGVRAQHDNDESRNRAVNRFLLGSAALLLALMGFWLHSSFRGRIRALTAYAARIARGELDAPISSDVGKDLGELAHSLNGVAHELSDKCRALAEVAALRCETDRVQEAVKEAEAATRKAQRVEEYQRTEIAKLAGVLTRIAKGDLAARYEAGQTEGDAAEAHASFLELERALNASTRTLGKIIHKIQRVSDELFAAAQEFVGFSSSLLSSSESMALQAGNVAGATEEMSMSINTMASAAEEISVNVNTVSATAELMSQSMGSVADAAYGMRDSIDSIAESAVSGARVADQAKGMAQNATSAMSALGDAAQAIGKVTGVIKRIAEQTNLLALNATIEAASAGDAGRGFAVVAHEIKELANQSAKAAEDIAGKIEGVQVDTARAISVIAEVARVIARIDEAVTNITDAVEKQTQSADAISSNVGETTRGAAEIAQAIAELARGANDMSQNAGEVARGANEVAANILGVSRSVEQGRSGATRSSELAERLSGAAGELRDMVGAFVVSAATDAKHDPR
jgi:methyl-accepting chemotaxis protein